MAGIVDLGLWRNAHRPAASAADGAPSHPITPLTTDEADPATVARLERAVERLHPLIERALEGSGRLQPRLETELLAIMGELTVGLVSEAAGRAERLAGRLEASG
jgi:hypothetical protein